MSLEWKRPTGPPKHLTPHLGQRELEEIIGELVERPGEWAIVRRVSTRQTARRIIDRFRDYRGLTAELHDEENELRIYARYDEVPE